LTCEQRASWDVAIGPLTPPRSRDVTDAKLHPAVLVRSPYDDYDLLLRCREMLLDEIHRPYWISAAVALGLVSFRRAILHDAFDPQLVHLLLEGDAELGMMHDQAQVAGVRDIDVLVALADAKINTHATAEFRMVQWMTATPEGTLFLMDGGDLRRVSPDCKVASVAAKLTEHKTSPAKVSDRNYHMGLWSDAKGAVYVAVAQERLVLQVQADGRTKVFARSGESWSPSGGMFDRDGNLWLLEYDSANAVRARRIDRDGRERIFGTDTPRR